jgi:hypothetical protein
VFFSLTAFDPVHNELNVSRVDFEKPIFESSGWMGSEHSVGTPKISSLAIALPATANPPISFYLPNVIELKIS